MGVELRGWGSALPEKIVTNADFASRLDTSDEWIVERTGIRERRFGGSTGSLAVEAGQRAMDLNAACSGFVYAVVAGAGLCEMGAERVLVIGADVMSRITDQDDRGTAILFGDGAGAVVLDRIDGPSRLLGWDLGSDGSLRHLLSCDAGGYTQMNGKEVFRQAVRVMVDSCTKALERAGRTSADVTLLVPHQANTRIVSAACDRLGIPMDRTALVLERTGNTSAGSVPLALADAADNGRLADGDIVLLCGFGAGMTWASAVLQWGAT
jgi:3-oxoacyl-[acyl-carrier-protein] synthase-3